MRKGTSWAAVLGLSAITSMTGCGPAEMKTTAEMSAMGDSMKSDGKMMGEEKMSDDKMMGGEKMMGDEKMKEGKMKEEKMMSGEKK